MTTIDVPREAAVPVDTGTAAKPPPLRQGGVPPRPSSAEGSAHQHAAEPKPSLSKVVEQVLAAFSARFHLFELEAKRAAWAAAYMMAFAVGAALLGVTAWLILIGALIVGAVAAGVPWVAAVVVAIALHAVGVYFLVRGIRSMVDHLTFSATRRTLSRDNSSPPNGSGA